MMDLETTRSSRLWVIAAALVGLIAAGCGASGGDGLDAVRLSVELDSASTDDQSDDEAEPVGTTEPPTSTVAETTVPPETTARRVDPLPVVTLDELPDLVIEWAAAADDPTIDPLDIARRLIGFPLPIPVPDGATVFRLDLDMFGGDPSADWHWEWAYTAHANEPVGDVDINLEDKGTGTVDLARTYDPIMADLGWRRTGTTTSDPGDPGGPNSVNHVYTYEGEPFVIGGAAASPDPTFVWLDEDLIYGDEEDAGYRIDVNLDLEPGVVVIPLLDLLFAALPTVDGARLTGIDFSTSERSADSFDAAEGLRYFDLEFRFELPDGSAETAMDTYAGLDGTTYRAADESFFDPGFYEPADPSLFGETWTQPILVLERYPGNIKVSTGADGPVVATLEMRFEPNRELLQPLPA